eukprot:403357221
MDNNPSLVNVDNLIQEFNAKNLSEKNLENLETDYAFQNLLSSLTESYEKDLLSMKYKDKNLELEYLLLFYLASRRWLFIATTFTMLQSLFFFVIAIELMILGNPGSAAVDGYIIVPAIMVSAAYASYDQRTTLLSYLFITIYNFIRTYNWINENFRYARFNIYVVITLGIVYTFSRFSQKLDREKFEQNKNQKQLLQLFHNLIKVYHDGIVITQEKDIVYNNKAIPNIFNIKNSQIDLEASQQILDNSQQLNHLNSDHDLISQRLDLNQDIENEEIQRSHHQNRLQLQVSMSQQKQQRVNKKIVDALQKSKPKSQQLFSHSTIPENDLESQEQYFSDLWDYIQKNQQYLDPTRFNRDFLINPLDGMYFKLKQKYLQHDNHQSQENIHDKVLQVFTQSLRLGNKVYVMTTIRDQSTWLEIEKQKNMSQLKTIAFASAAHEFRNPLNAINSSLQVVDSQIKDSETRKFLQTAKNCSRLMLFLVNDILDFSQLESKKLVLSYENVNIRKLSEECFSILQLKAQIKELEFVYEFSENFPQKIYTDQNRLAQILINLLSNSLKYTQEGFVKLIGTVNLQEKQILLVVDDSGVGMSQSQISQLFTTFTKIMDNRQLNKEGVGLGLTISKNLANALGGDITVVSQVDKGSQFTLILPYEAQMENSKEEISNEYDAEISDVHIQIDNISENNYNVNQSLILNPFNDKASQLQRIIPKDKVLIYNKQIELLKQNANNFYSDNIRNKKNSRQLRRGNTGLFDDLIAKNINKKQWKQSQIHDVEGLQYASIGLNSHSYVKLNSEKSEKAQITNIKIQPVTCECPKILIVDDDPFNLMALQGLLKQLNIDKVDQCFNGKQAIEKILQNQKRHCLHHQSYDLIITDNQMPVMSGIEATKELRKIQEEQQNLRIGKIVLLTGDESMITNDKYQQLFDDIILKPIDTNILGVLLMQTSSLSQS